jgi:talin
MGSTNRQELISSATAVSNSSQDLLKLIDSDHADPSQQESCNLQAKQVATASSQLISQAKNIAGACGDPSLQNAVITSAKTTALAASQLMACMKLLTPVINSWLCQDQLFDAAQYVVASVTDLVTHCQSACSNEASRKALGEDAHKVSRELSTLINDLKAGDKSQQYEDDFEIILQASDALQNSLGNAVDMLRHAKTVVMTTNKLLEEMKADTALISDKAKVKEATMAARVLTTALNDAVNAAKTVARTPKDSSAQGSLASSMSPLRTALLASASGAAQRKLIKQTVKAVKLTCSSVTQLIAAAQGASAYSTNDLAQKQLIGQCKLASDAVALLIAAVKQCTAQKESPSTQLELINSSKVCF